jgi:hypothetical protein
MSATAMYRRLCFAWSYCIVISCDNLLISGHYITGSEGKGGSASETSCASLMLEFIYRSYRKKENCVNGVKVSVAGR